MSEHHHHPHNHGLLWYWHRLQEKVKDEEAVILESLHLKTDAKISDDGHVPKFGYQKHKNFEPEVKDITQE